MRTEDGQIISKCLNGDQAAFGFLVDKYKASVYALAYNRLRNFQDAEDVSQEAFIEAYQRLHTLRRWDSFSIWLYSITSNMCKEWLRAKSRRRDRDFIADQSLDAFKDNATNSYYDDKIYESLNDALNALPEVYQQVVTLYYLGGMNSEEISRLLGISPTAIRQRLSRARSQLREEILNMVGEAFEQRKLSASFTFRIVEMVKKIRIHPTSGIKGLPYGLSLSTGLIIAILSLGQYIQINLSDIATGFPFPSETKILEVGEIPVDAVKISNIPFIAGKQGDGRGVSSILKGHENAFLMAPQVEGDTWVKRADMPTARDSLSASVVNGKIYAIGGCDANFVSLKNVEEYDPVNDTWTKKADMPTARMVLSTGVVDGKIYAIGGGRENCYSAVEVYDPVTDTWSKCKDMPTARRLLSISAVNGKIYAIGGDNKFGPCLSTVEEYDPVKNTWTKKADMPTARCGLSTCVVNGEIYAIGGIPVNVQAWNALSTVEIYNPVTDKWTKKTDMPTPRCVFSTCVVDKKIYAVGGALVQPSVVTSKVEVYDPETDTWTEKADMQFARGWLATSEVNGKIYAIGGSTDVDFLPTVEEYTPEGWSSAVFPQGKLPTRWGFLKKNKH